VSRTGNRIMLLVRVRSSLPFDELQRRLNKRMPEFRALPGLIQKYYLHDKTTDEVCGFYLWDSEESLKSYLASDLRKTIASAYEAVGEPRVERFELLDVLRQ